MPVLKYWDPALGRYAPLKGGPPGPPVEIDADAETLPAGSEATVETSGDRGQQLLSFGIPRGDKGETGAVGPTGRVDEIWSSTPPPGAHGRRWIDPSATSVAPPEGHSHNQYITEELADARYEKKLLTQAVAWYDAGNVGADRLLDLSGNGRDAIFGAGAAKPVVLPWDGEDYVHVPDNNGNGVSGAGIASPQAASSVEVILHFRQGAARTVYEPQVFQLSTGTSMSTRFWYVVRKPTGFSSHRSDGTATQGLLLKPSAAVRDWLRFTYASDGTVTMYDSDDGTTWVQVGSAVHTGNRLGFDTRGVRSVIGNGSGGFSDTGDLYEFRVAWDGGSPTHILDPRNVSADYTKIRNTGTAGGDWTIARAASGFKTAVVDRPLLLFGGGQGALTAIPPAQTYRNGMTYLYAYRTFGALSKDAFPLHNKLNLSANAGFLFMDRLSVYGTAWIVDGAVRHDISHGTRPTPGTTVIASSKDAGTNGVGYVNGAVVSRRTNMTAGTITINQATAIGQQSEQEFIGAAIFDRALTDAEVAQASAELLGTPMHEQADPLPQYILAPSTTVRRHGEWETAATWAALPSTGNWLGRRVKVLDGLGLCVAVWDGAKWQVDPVSDTGWHVPSGVVPPFALSGGRIRRLGPLVAFEYQRLVANGGTGHALTLPLSFCQAPAGSTTQMVIADYNGSAGALCITSGQVTFVGSGATSAMISVRLATWNTDAAWPTTAP